MGIGAFILIFVLFLLIVGLGFTAFYFIKKSDPNALDSTNSNNMRSAQDFLPFVDIRDSMIHLGNNEYRAIIEVASVNYDLRNADEQAQIERTFRQMLNGLGANFPITLFISTRDMDYTQLIESLVVDYSETLGDFPMMEDYMNQNLQDMRDLAITQEDTRHKKKYIIIPYDANQLTESTEEGKYKEVESQMKERILQIMEGIGRISGASSELLSTIDLMDLLIETYHRDGSRFGEALHETSTRRADLLSTIIVGDSTTFNENQYTEEERFDMMLAEMQASIENQFLIDERVSPEMKREATAMWERINDSRQDEDFNGVKVKNHEQRFEEIRARQEELAEHERRLVNKADALAQEEKDIRRRADALKMTESELSELSEELEFEKQIQSGEVMTFGPTSEHEETT